KSTKGGRKVIVRRLAKGRARIAVILLVGIMTCIQGILHCADVSAPNRSPTVLSPLRQVRWIQQSWEFKSSYISIINSEIPSIVFTGC
ncbi:unnamed protein product, partial [Musa acuminata subsp. burmannicoides]